MPDASMPEAPLPEGPLATEVAPADRRALRRLLLLGSVALLLALGYGVRERLQAGKELQAISAAAAMPSVTVVLPRPVAADSVVLPGRLQAWTEAPLFARTNGFLRRRMADIGDHVKVGQLLAEIEAPEIEQQLAAAMAALATAQAQLELASVTARRWNELAERSVVSQQAMDERRGSLATRIAMRNEAAANVNRLKALNGFTQVMAPFDGVVTSRATDVGALIVSGDTRSLPLFTISDTSRLRLYVRVPQLYVGAIHQGMQAQFTVPDQPDRRFTAEVTRSAGAVDVQSGAMLVQLVVNNAAERLKPGGYAQVRLEIPPSASSHAVRVPASALIFRSEGTAIAVVNSGGQVTVKPVHIGQDLGTDLDIDSGLSRTDFVIDSPSDSIRTGDQVAFSKPQG